MIDSTPKSNSRPPEASSVHLISVRMKEITVAVFGQPSHIFDSVKFPPEDFLHRFDQAVRDPTRELMEGDQVVSFLKVLGWERGFQRCAWPNIAKGSARKTEARGPDGR